MNFSLSEILLTLSMVLAVIILSFVGPALGMGGDNVNETDIPKLNITESNYNFIKKPQDPRPQAPTRGVLNHSSDEFDNYQGSIQYELGKDNNGNRTFLVVLPENTTNITDVENSSIEDSVTFSSNDTTNRLSANGFTVDVYSVDYKAGVYEYHITQSPDPGFFAGVSNALEPYAAWIGNIWYSFYNFLIDDTLNFGNKIFQYIAYFIDLFGWILTTYNGLITGAPSAWVSVFLVIPEIYIIYQFIKVILTILPLIPFIG